jgi:hypothetical protein
MKQAKDEPRLLTPSEVDGASEAGPAQEILKWVRDFLAQPHGDLGREGPVCPFVPRALKLGTLWIGIVEADPDKPEDMEAIVDHYRKVFLDLEPKQGSDAVFKTIILIFPRVSSEQAPVLIDGVQKKLKPGFVDDGLMLGQFHEKNDEPGLHNKKFRPLRSPIPLLAIRFMVKQDLPFLTQETDSVKLRLRFIKGYIKASRQQLESTHADKQALKVIEAFESIASELEKAAQDLP